MIYGKVNMEAGPEVFYQFLKNLAPVNRAEFMQSMAFFHTKTLKRGDVFIHHQEIARKVAFIVSGILRSYYITDNGAEITYCFCTERRFSTSFKSFISQTPSQYIMEASTDAELLIISYEDLQYLYSTFPVWQQIGRIATEQEYMELEKFTSILQGESAIQKYHRMLNEAPEIIQQVPVNHIASYLGVTRETLSRIRKQVSAEIR